MKHKTLPVVAGAVLIVVALCAGPTSPAPSAEPSQIEQLRQEIASLRQRVESLERRLNDRAFVVPRGDKESPMIIRPPCRPGPVPKDWRPFEFNGTRYYIVPVNTPQAPAQEPVKQPPAPQK
ncbi:MAG: hypothetical protein JW955_08620 [Sedimentisphaerales bacterium]|nr:hypothetical protein [Sedimentisphaerales bacterium]